MLLLGKAAFPSRSTLAKAHLGINYLFYGMIHVSGHVSVDLLLVELTLFLFIVKILQPIRESHRNIKVYTAVHGLVDENVFQPGDHSALYSTKNMEPARSFIIVTRTNKRQKTTIINTNTIRAHSSPLVHVPVSYILVLPRKKKVVNTNVHTHKMFPSGRWGQRGRG